MAKHFFVFVLFLIGIGISIFLSFRQLADQNFQEQPQPTQNLSPSESEAKRLTPSPLAETIISVLQSGKDRVCEFSYSNDFGKGVIYIANSKIRADFKTAGLAEKDIENHLIIDGKNYYFWNNSKGTKAKVDQNLKESIASASAQQLSLLDNFTRFDCSSWTPDKNKFIPPKNVEFIENSQNIQPKISTPSSNI